MTQVTHKDAAALVITAECEVLAIGVQHEFKRGIRFIFKSYSFAKRITILKNNLIRLILNLEYLAK